jgi:hypothetical protein
VEVLGEFFFMVNDIDIHQLNLRPFKSLKFLDEIPFKKCRFLHFMHNNFFFLGKDHYHMKKEKILWMENKLFKILFYFSNVL